MPTSKSSPKARKTKTSAARLWKGVPSKPSVTTAKADPARVRRIVQILHDTYPGAACSLDFSDPFQLLVATVLSAQCTDERVNRVTPGLFARFPTPFEMAQAPLSELEDLIRSTGFFRNKAKNIQASARVIVERHGGRVPQTMDELSCLPGVGRKTANVVLGNAFGIPGMVVDTHVGRLSRRMGLTKNEDPEKVERDLEALVDRDEWTNFSHLLIQHGRNRCQARKPDCDNCELLRLCPRRGV